MLEFAAVERAALHPAEESDDVQEDDQVQDPDQEQERARDPGADQPAHTLELAAAVDDVRLDELRRDPERDRDQEHNGRMSQGEEETNPERLLPFLQELSGGVVDGRDVVSVEGVPEAE